MTDRCTARQSAGRPSALHEARSHRPLVIASLGLSMPMPDRMAGGRVVPPLLPFIGEGAATNRSSRERGTTSRKSAAFLFSSTAWIAKTFFARSTPTYRMVLNVPIRKLDMNLVCYLLAKVRQHQLGNTKILATGLCLGALIFSANAFAWGDETTEGVLSFFSGCTIKTPPTDKGHAEIQGSCLDHTFSGSADGLPPYPKEQCFISLDPGYGTVRNCLVDGQPAASITFHRRSKRLREITWISLIDAAGHILTRQAVFERDDQAVTTVASTLANKCKSQFAIEPTGPSIYGLSLGDLLPCSIDKCEVSGSKAPMCFASVPKATHWGTTQVLVRLNSEVFELTTILKTGNPVLELLQEGLVGIVFPDVDPDFEADMASQLSSKFGQFQLRGRTYWWTTPAASVRYSVSDHLRPGAMVLGLLTGDAGGGSGSVTIYTPNLRVLVQKYEDEQAKAVKKRGL